ncbi:hypothetical protein E2C01_029492 [Portunus trituberculatus]|uniref:Uncharacterized protein n=1 Tax=Portunus trituberculatus TaxID=210409 RepID=A0A5B7ES13_PORTR|nr:hypothetical protein [Portunus trituberculatus]
MIGSLLARRVRKKCRMPAWAITSTVPAANFSAGEGFPGLAPGRSSVGPNTVANNEENKTNKINEIHTTTSQHPDNSPLNVSFLAAEYRAWDGLHSTVSSVSEILLAQ